MGVSKRRIFILAPLGLVLITTGFAVAWFVLQPRDKTSSSNTQETKTFQVLAAQTSLPLYATKNTTAYKFKDAVVADETIVIATYETNKGDITVTNQPKPTVDPFLTIEPVDKFATSIGDARLYPDDQQEPYIVVYAPLTWLVIRSSSEQIGSNDLKAFVLSLAATTN
ncbi:MAG: hypothetical protein KIH63_003075 [Candidatus Saccharibacteria bacterium]|nr:hypothetical protein [Candidatus Saccharibacteria bacterium]